MKYSILGFSQPALIENNIQCDLTDLVLLNYIMYAQANPKMLHTMDENNIPHVWLSHKKILEDLPILNISAGTLKNRIVSLKEKEYISSVVRAHGKGRGSMAFYAVSPLIYDIRYETTRLKKDDLKPRPGVKKITSNDDTGIKNVTPNNILNINNKLDIDNKKTTEVVCTKVPTYNSTDINTDINDYDKKEYYKLLSGKLIKKTTKSPNYLREYISNLHNINNIEINGECIDKLLKWYYEIGIGITSIKQLDNKLTRLSNDCNGQLHLIIQAIDNAYVNGWKAFYAPKQFYKNNSHLILNTNASIPLGKNFNPETDAARDEDGNLIVF